LIKLKSVDELPLDGTTPPGDHASMKGSDRSYFTTKLRPSAKFFRRVSPLLKALERYFSYEVQGWENIPKRGPTLLVMNHGVLPFHAFLLTRQIYTKVGRLPRTLAAEFLFQLPVVRDLILRGGGLNASRRNAGTLLKRGDLVTVAPGGIYEALLIHPGAKRIPWQRRYGFVAVALKLQVPIIPSYCEGINEAYLTSQVFLKKRIRRLKKSRFAWPLFFGIGLLPFPVKLTHWIGHPIETKVKKGETFRDAVRRIHHEVLAAMKDLQEMAKRRS
jgi:1-acyl-sn-glycerol-3-phosphate acyltransferase